MVSAALSRAPMMQVRPLRERANLMAARTLGSMEPPCRTGPRRRALGLVGGEVLELLLVGLAEVDGDMLNGGQQEQNVGVAVLGQQLAARVLVDDGRNALVAALVLVVADDGDAAATAGDDDELVVEQVEDGVSLDDLLGIGEATTRRQPRPESSTKTLEDPRP